MEGERGLVKVDMFRFTLLIGAKPFTEWQLLFCRLQVSWLGYTVSFFLLSSCEVIERASGQMFCCVVVKSESVPVRGRYMKITQCFLHVPRKVWCGEIIGGNHGRCPPSINWCTENIRLCFFLSFACYFRWKMKYSLWAKAEYLCPLPASNWHVYVALII